jgi:hypothetical protein
MIDRLHNALLSLEHLSPEAQEEAATYIEALVEALRHASLVHARSRDVPREGAVVSVQWQDPFGAWSDLPDTMLDELDQLRHMSQPTLPLELL